MEFILKTTFDATAKEIYEAWLSSEGHTRMTGGSANISDKIGTKFTAWDGQYKGEPFNTGVFVYFAKQKLMDGSVESISGNVTLIR